MRRTVALAAAALTALGSGGMASAVEPPEEPSVDLSRAVVVAPDRLDPAERKAVDLLVGEVQRRTGIRLPIATRWPASATPVIAVGPAKEAGRFAGPLARSVAQVPADQPEGFRIRVESDGPRPVALVVGNGPRGLLFGIGRLLRAVSWGRGRLRVPATLDVVTAPRQKVRGHQVALGKGATCGATWSASDREQYVRDLILFGVNTVEVVVPPEADAADLDAVGHLLGMAAGHGLAVSLALPAPNPRDLAATESRWAPLFDQVRVLDGLLLTVGDGRPDPAAFLAFAGREVAAARRRHATSEVWLLPPRVDLPTVEAFREKLRTPPEWLKGVVYENDPQMPLLRFRGGSPRGTALRHHPDLSRSQGGRIPVPGWDLAYAVTYGVRPVNPRPQAMAELARAVRYGLGFVTRSEGCHDDVNKTIYSALGWDSGTGVTEVLRQYARTFVGPALERPFADLLAALEANWQGPLAANEGVEATLALAQEIERRAPDAVAGNWRVQQAVHRAYQDAFVRRRLLHEALGEAEILDNLREENGSAAAIGAAIARLDREGLELPQPALRTRIVALARALGQSAGMRLPIPRVEPTDPTGTSAPLPDAPLGNRLYLATELRRAATLPAASRTAAVASLLMLSRPPSGGRHDDVGRADGQPHLVARGPLDGEPGTLVPVPLGLPLRDGATAAMKVGELLPAPAAPRAHWTCAPTPDGDALEMRYRGLDPRVRYRVQVLYVGETASARVRLAADGRAVHPFLETKQRPLSFDLPAAATSDGDVTLTFTHAPGKAAGNHRCQVAEVTLSPADRGR